MFTFVMMMIPVFAYYIYTDNDMQNHNKIIQIEPHVRKWLRETKFYIFRIHSLKVITKRTNCMGAYYVLCTNRFITSLTSKIVLFPVLQQYNIDAVIRCPKN